MTWFWIFTVIFFFIKLITSPPNIVAGWFIKKFELHQKLDPQNITVTFNGKNLEEEEKIRFTDYFNEATFLKKHYIFPGHEKLFLEPETNVPPFVVNVKKGKKDIHFFVYKSEDHVDVVKQYKEKVVSYSINSDNLLRFTVSN